MDCELPPLSRIGRMEAHNPLAVRADKYISNLFLFEYVAAEKRGKFCIVFFLN